MMKQMHARLAWSTGMLLAAAAAAGCAREASQQAVEQKSAVADLALRNGAIYTVAGARGRASRPPAGGRPADAPHGAQGGDRRGYLVRRAGAKARTKDQAVTQTRREAGERREGGAAMSDRRNIILQALAPEQNIKVDL